MNDGSHSYEYDAEGNVMAVDNGATATYVYDAYNRRVRVQTASSTDEYIYDYAGRRISTWDVSGDLGVEGRIYWGNLPIAFRASNGDTYFDQKDLVGTSRLRMNYAGVAEASYISLPFGDDYAVTGNTDANQDNNHFAQLDHDTESGTDHAQFRQYGNAWGRWMSPDPYNGSYDIANPQSFNRYNYAMNNPLVFTDPNGRDPFTITVLVFCGGAPGACAGAAINAVAAVVLGGLLAGAELGDLLGLWGGATIPRLVAAATEHASKL